jgi:hypothetical protein
MVDRGQRPSSFLMGAALPRAAFNRRQSSLEIPKIGFGCRLARRILRPLHSWEACMRRMHPLSGMYIFEPKIYIASEGGDLPRVPVKSSAFAKRLTASRFLRDLQAAGFVTCIKEGSELLFVNDRLMALLLDRAPRAI